MAQRFGVWAEMEAKTRAKILKQRPYYFVKCQHLLSFSNTLMENEELLHIHWGHVIYSEACEVMDTLLGERYRIHVEFNNEIKKVSLHKLLRKTNTGVYGVRMCHMNPDKEFVKTHFYPGGTDEQT